MNLATLRNTLRTKVGNPTTTDVTDDTLTRIINAAYREITDKYPFSETRSTDTVETVAGTMDYYLPYDLSILQRVWDSTNSRKLRKRGMRFYASLPSNIPQGKPTDYVRLDQSIRLVPTPDAVYTINFFYIVAIVDLDQDESVPLIPSAWHDGLILRARHMYYDERGDIGKAIYCKNEWKDWVSDKPSEIDQEKVDLEDRGVVIPTLGPEYARFRSKRDRRFDGDFDDTLD